MVRDINLQKMHGQKEDNSKMLPKAQFCAVKYKVWKKHSMLLTLQTFGKQSFEKLTFGAGACHEFRCS